MNATRAVIDYTELPAPLILRDAFFDKVGVDF